MKMLTIEIFFNQILKLLFTLMMSTLSGAIISQKRSRI